MTVTIRSTASFVRFVTLSRVKAELEISSTDSSNDNYLWSLIDEAGSRISNYTNRTFPMQDYTESVGASDRSVLVLDNAPLVSVDRVISGDSRSTTYTVISSTEYFIDDDKAGILYRRKGWSDTRLYYQNIFEFPRPVNESKRFWTVDYRAGYAMPSTLGSSLSTFPTKPTLPFDLQRACIDLVKISYASRGNNPLVKSEKTGDASQTLFSASETIGGIPLGIASTLDNYKRTI